MKKLSVLLAALLLIIIGGVYAYNSSNTIQVSEGTKHRVEYDTKIVSLKNNTSHKRLVQLEITNEVKTTFGNYQTFSVEYKEVILEPGEEKTVDIIQYHTRKARYDIVKEIELK